MSKKSYFSLYKSPNIVIVPTFDKNIPPLKKTKIKNDITENTQIFQTMSVNKNVTKKKHLNNKNVPSIDSEQDGNQKVEEIPKEINNCDLKIGNKVDKNLKSKIKHSNLLKATKSYVKEEMPIDSYGNKCEAILTEPRSLKRCIDKSSENLTINNRFNKEPIQKSETCLVKHNFRTDTTNLTDNYKIKSKTEVKLSIINCETDKYSNHSSQKQNENKQKFKSNKSKISKSEKLVQVEDMDEKNNSHFKSETTIEDIILKNKIGNSCVNLKSKKSDLCRQTKTKVDKPDNTKRKTRKIIKIVINVTYNNLQEKKNAKIMRESEHDKNPDLSFLDDFDVDEVVESLFPYKNTKENTLNIKENKNKSIQVKDDIDNTLKKSSTLFTKQKIKKEDIKKLKLPKTASKATEKKLELNKHEVQHISGNIDVEKLCSVSHNNDRSLEKVVDKIKANDHKNNKKMVKILPLKTNNVTETNLNFKEFKVLDTKPDKNQLIICNNTIHTKESSKDFSSSDNDCVTATDEKNVMNAINIPKERINNECSLVKNDYHTDNILSRRLEIKMCDLLTEKYSINTVAHDGKFSKIFKCTDMVTGKNYAVKMLNKCDYYVGKRKTKILQKIQQEIPKENLSCIFLLSSFTLDGHWCYMTHYYFTNLQQVLQNERKSFHIDEIRNLSMQLVLALFVVRNKNIVHSDIKPSHILLNSKMKELKLCGFDEACYYNNSKYLSANIGTVNYRAPEIILGYSNGFSIDIWSMALVMYEMVTSQMLFSGETNNDILYKQISIFGNFPYSMVMQSRFNKDHFVGTNFVRNGYCNKDKQNINSFGNDGSIQKMIMDAYEKHWGKINTKNEIIKLNSLCHLLEKMFILDPKHRLPVEYVYANPFFAK